MTSVVPPSPYHKALILCVSDYDHYAPLLGPRKDVFEVRRVLVAPKVGLFAPANVHQWLNLTHDRADDEICNFLDGSKKTDHLLFYFSGHGALDEAERLHLGFVNTKPRRLSATGVRWASIVERIESARAASVTTILDCCYSGQSKGGGTVPLGAFKASGRCKLASCLEVERSKDAQRAGEPSPFTELVVQAFEHPVARACDKGYVSPADVAQFVDENHGAILPYTPMSETRGVGQIALAPDRAALPPRPPRPPWPRLFIAVFAGALLALVGAGLSTTSRKLVDITRPP